MEEIPDSQLLAGLRGSDTDALCRLYLRYASRVRSIAYRLLGDMDDAEDVAQDVFLKVWNAREALPEIVSMPSYLSRMTYNAVLNLLKKRQAHRGYVEFSLKYTPAIEEEKVTAADLSRAIDRELSRLPENQREAFALSRLDGQTYDEISSRLGISRKTVQYHISRVLRRLRHLVGRG